MINFQTVWEVQYQFEATRIKTVLKMIFLSQRIFGFAVKPILCSSEGLEKKTKRSISAA